MSTTKYPIGFEFTETDKYHSDKYHWRITDIKSGRYICVDIWGKAKHSPLTYVTDDTLDRWLKHCNFKRVKSKPCVYCGNKMEVYKKTMVCTECYRIQE